MEIRNINDLLEQKSTVNPTELDEQGLNYSCQYADYQVYKDDKCLYFFNMNKIDPLLDFYAKFDKKPDVKFYPHCGHKWGSEEK